MKLGNQKGSLTLEYIMLTLFGTITAIASVTYLGKMTKDHLEKVEASFQELTIEDSFNKD
jgi:hypothetical protein